jgi:hypothetical protein
MDRFFWPRGDELGVLDISYDRFGGMLTDLEGAGHMEPPMLMNHFPGSFFEGPTRYFPSMSGEGSFTFYMDHLCKEKAP